MLVLTRKLMEKLYIGDDICVTVVRLEGGQVRLGIEAPREIAVVRAELLPERNAVTQNASAHPTDGAADRQRPQVSISRGTWNR
ncbi:carbon storage regulator [Singulisphaera sp. Ch08]|uniref:Translational regulator CsrA n=1 Tax=Singulisphaera sp. Ch08 TaxID=3120278 RepID=A0AAU7CQR9_9BACT